MINPLVTVLTPAPTTALTTLDRVKAELSISGLDSDTALMDKILETSEDIAARCAPWLRREKVTETFYVDYKYRYYDALWLSRYPVASVDSVVVDGVTLAATDYVVDTANGALYKKSTSSVCYYYWSFTETVVVTYTGGYLLPGQLGRNLPRPIEAACIELMSSSWMSKGRDPFARAEEAPGVYRIEYGFGPASQSSGGGLPPSVSQKLDPYLKKQMVF